MVGQSNATSFQMCLLSCIYILKVEKLLILLDFVTMTAHTLREDDIIADNGGLHGWTRTLEDSHGKTQLLKCM